MITLTVKTLDNRNHEFEVDDEITVRQFKEHIGESVNISPDSQRLIYHGKVLKDTLKLSEYGVNNNVIHLVERPPPPPGGVARQRSPSPPRRYFESGNAVYLGSVSYPANSSHVRELLQMAPTQRFSSSRLSLARRMIRNAELVLTQLERSSSSNTNNMDLQEESTPLYTEEVVVEGNAPIESIQETIENIASNRANAASTSQDTNVPSTSDATNRASSSNRPTVCFGANLVEVLDQMNRFHIRFRPVYERYCNFLRDDPVIEGGNSELVEQTQTMLNKVSQIIHFLAHAYHAISDLICNVESPRPRPLLCRPYSVQHTTLVQTGIPLQLEAHIDMDARRSETSATTASTTSETTTSTTSAVGATTTVTTATDSTTSTSSTQTTGTAGIERNVRTMVTTQSGSMLPRVQLRNVNMNMLDSNMLGQGDLSDANVEVFMEMTPSVVTLDSNMIPLSSNGGVNYGDFVRQLMSTFNPATIMSQVFDLNGNRQAQARAQTSGSATVTTIAMTTSENSAAASTTGQTSQARSNTQTNPTTSTHTRSSSRPHVHVTQQTLRKFDPYLPCRSHHIPFRRHNDLRNRADAATTMSSNRATNTNSTNEGDLENTLHDFFDQMSRDYSVNNGGVVSSSSGNNGRNFSNSAAFIRSSRRSHNHDSVQVAEPPEPSGVTTFNFDIATSSTSGDNRHFNGIEYFLHSSEHSMTIANLLLESPRFNYIEGESLLMDLLMIIPLKLTIFDFIEMINGNFEKMKSYLEEIVVHLENRLLKKYQSIEASQPEFEAFFQDLSKYLDKLAEYNVVFDVPASLKLLLREQLPQLFNAILKRKNSMEVKIFQNIINNFLNIIIKNEQNKPKWLTITTALNLLTNGLTMDDYFLEPNWKWIQKTFISLMRILLEKNYNSSSHKSEKYFVKLNSETEQISSCPVDFEFCNEKDEVASSSKESESESVNVLAEKSIDFDVQKLPVTENASNHEIPNDLPSLNIIEIPDVAEPQPWHNELPPNWGPVINRDKVRQRKQEYSSTFSDAYMSGMPLKRRKILKTQAEIAAEKAEKDTRKANNDDSKDIPDPN